MSKLLGVLVAGLCATAAFAQPGGPAGAPGADRSISRLGSSASTGDRDRADADASRLGDARSGDRFAAAQDRDTDRRLGPRDRLDRFAQPNGDDRSYSRADRDDRDYVSRDRDDQRYAHWDRGLHRGLERGRSQLHHIVHHAARHHHMTTASRRHEERVASR